MKKDAVQYKRTRRPFRVAVMCALSSFGRLIVSAVFAACLALFPVHVGAEATYFRLTNADGSREMKATISAEEAKRGYQVVTLSGRVIKTVEPEMTPEQYAALSSARKQALEQQRAEKEERAYNESLLLRYSSVEDLEAERKRKLGEFDERIIILRGNMTALKSQVERQQSAAADLERRGTEVPDVLRDDIRDRQEQVRDAESALAVRQAEKAEVDARYAADIERFKQLVGDES